MRAPQRRPYDGFVRSVSYIRKISVKLPCCGMREHPSVAVPHALQYQYSSIAVPCCAGGMLLPNPGQTLIHSRTGLAKGAAPQIFDLSRRQFGAWRQTNKPCGLVASLFRYASLAAFLITLQVTCEICKAAYRKIHSSSQYLN